MSKRVQPFEQHLLREYLGDRLDDATREAFELHLLAHPVLAELAEIDAQMQAGLSQPAEPPIETPNGAPATLTGSARLGNDIPRRYVAAPRSMRWVALAASVLIAFGMGYGSQNLNAPQSASVALVYLDQVRAEGDPPSSLKPSTSAQTVLMIPVAARDCAHSVRLSQGKQLLSARLEPDSYGIAALALQPGVLKPGVLLAEVSCDGKPQAQYELLITP